MAESLRDQLSAVYDEVTQQEPETPKAEPQAPPAAESLSEGAEKPGRTFGRDRDEKGRLLPGPAKKESAAEPKTPPATDPNAQAAPEALAAATVSTASKPHPNRPSSWKKEYWDHWGKLDPSVAEYILQRENEYSKGVSTYKSEWENAKPLLDAVEPYRGLLQQHGIEPASHVKNLMEAHKVLALGSPQQKLVSFAKLIQDYQVPIEQLLVQGQDGKIYFNQQIFSQAQQQPQQRHEQPDVRKTVQEVIAQERASAEAAAMEADTKTYPHFTTVKETMAGLLQAGLAQDLKSAYEAAIRMPLHSDIWEAMQTAQREAQEKEKQEAQRKATEAARRNLVSPKGQTPAGRPAGDKKGLRATLESAFDEHVVGRV